MMSFARKTMHLGAVALMLSTVAGAATFMTADAAYAERGGNGNGNANGRNRDRDERGNGNGRGAIASELKWLNAAHANQNALENASPNSRPGQLYVFQTTYNEAQTTIAEAETAETDAQTEYDRLIGLSEEEIEEEFADGGYEDAVTAAAVTLEEAQTGTDEAYALIDEALMTLTDGRELSDDAYAELLGLLGLDEEELAEEDVTE